MLPINRGWRYSSKVVDAAHGADFDDSSFERVVVPHTNVRLPWHGFADSSYEFVSMYRRPIKVPADAKGKRIFVDFEGVMTASTVWLNGKKVGSYRGGYTPFSFELTRLLDPGGKNVLSVDVDSTERADIPPFGNEIDYLTFGGIYREVSLRVVPQTFIENIHVQTRDVLNKPALDVTCFLDRAAGTTPGKLSLKVELRDGEQVLAQATSRAATPQAIEMDNADAGQGAGSALKLPIDGTAQTVSLSRTAEDPALGS